MSTLGQNARRVFHRFYLPMATCLDNAVLTDNPFRDPGDLYGVLATAGRLAYSVTPIVIKEHT
jgi:hypothetical protein